MARVPKKPPAPKTKELKISISVDGEAWPSYVFKCFSIERPSKLDGGAITINFVAANGQDHQMLIGSHQELHSSIIK